jgi:hypothetical protein
MRHRHRPLVALTALLAALVCAGPAHAGEVIVVDGQHATRVNDPFVPTRAQASLGALPSAERGRVGAASRRGRAAGVRAASASARAQAAGTRPSRAVRAMARVLARSRAKRLIDKAAYARYRSDYAKARRTLRRLSGARRAQLGYVLGSVERLALSGKLNGTAGATRMPAAFLQLRRNTQYWPKLPFPAVGDQISFRGSEVLFQHYSGEGLQIQVLSTFKKANLIHGACTRQEAGCDPEAIRRLLDEMTGLAVQRSKRFIAWEYQFSFDGGSPPWISGMAEATAIQAYARAAQLLNEPSYVATANKALPVFMVAPPLGVRTRGFRGGVHYLQYSFAPGLYIFNAFLQSLIGLHDFAELTGSARALRLYEQAEPEARAEIPFSDLGDWTLYNYRGHPANASYHELLREFLQSMCTRKLGEEYCTYATKYAGYQTDPPELLLLGPETATAKQSTRIRFSLSKLSAVELKVYKGDKLTYSTLATFARGDGSFLWKPPSAGSYRIDIAAKELRTGLGKKDRDSGELEVEPSPAA